MPKRKTPLNKKPVVKKSRNLTKTALGRLKTKALPAKKISHAARIKPPVKNPAEIYFFNKKVSIFLALAFGLSWSVVGLFYALGGRLNQPLALPVLILYMWCPAISAIIVRKFISKEPLRGLGIYFKPDKWWLIAWLLPPAIAFLTLGISLLIPGIKFTPDMAGMFERYKNILSPDQIKQMKDSLKTLPVHPFWLILIQGLIAGLTVNAIAAFGEELGWRGFLFVETNCNVSQRRFWLTSLFIGTIWGLWHAPIIIQGYNYPQHPQLGVLLMTLWTILLTPWMLFLRIKSGSVINSAIYHGTINGTVGIAILLIQGGNDLTTGLLGLPGFLALIVVNGILFFYMKNGTNQESNNLN